MDPGFLRPRVIVLLLFGISAALALHYLDRGWVAHDAGALGHAAERVLAGELPHRDFDEIYTGGLTYLNALAFRVLGLNLISLRIVLYLFFLAWLPALYYVARRLAHPLAAAAVVLVSVVWSLPNYSAPVPSWYNLFMATFGIAAVVRYLESGRRRWLLTAGICGGLSFLAKLIGLYYIAGVLLFLAFHEQSAMREKGQAQPRRGWSYSLVVTTAVLFFLILLLRIVVGRMRLEEFVHFVLPGGLLSALFLFGEWKLASGESRERFGRLWHSVAPFTLGVALPVAIFLIPYVASGALADFYRGVFVAPIKRLGFATMRPPPILPALTVTAGLLLVLYASYRLRYPRSVKLALVGIPLLFLLIAAPLMPEAYRLVWHSIRISVPTTVVAGVLVLSRKPEMSGRPTFKREVTLLLLCVMAVHSLVQYPFSAPVYFLYVAPLVALVVLALLTVERLGSQVVPISLLCFYILFGVLWINTGFIYGMGLRYIPSDQTERLALDRGGVLVNGVEKMEYEAIVSILHANATGEYIYAAPDCPEVYFLSGLRNPTRTLFDFFDDPNRRMSEIENALDRHRVRFVVLNMNPDFSGGIKPELLKSLEVRYPEATKVGKFVVRWRD
ncbi:MAG: glycosyltransferase family 39 protein [Gemmatimonadota bacterium]|nr:MAG: glycosyltransferase family 39 protein [Gemmatimonadota bacterium]